MRKKFLILTIATLSLLISALTSLRSQEQKRTWETEVPTPVQDGVLTVQQKEHSKLYDDLNPRGKIRDLLQKQDELIVNLVPSLQYLSPEGESPIISQLAERADTIVIGSITSKSSQITSTGTFVFTDYSFRIEEVLKGIDAVTPKPQSTITVTRPGGKVLLNGRVVTFNDYGFQPLRAGRRYLLFLKYLPATGAYQAVNQKGRSFDISSFDISGTKVKTLSDEAQTQDFEKDLGAFITSVKVAIEHARKNGGAR